MAEITEPKKFSWQSMGTSFEVSIWDTISETLFLDIAEAVMAMSQDFDNKYSRFKRDSFVWSIAEKTGVIKVDADFMTMLKIYGDFYELSGKKFTPLIGNTISDMGYDDQYTLVPKETIRKTPDFQKTVTVLSDSEIQIAEPVLFDVGGVGKGYFVDKVAAFLKSNNIRRFLVNGSGDIFYEDAKHPLRVGLEHPEDPKKVIGVIELSQGSLASSGSKKRNWGKYHHIIDPLQLSSPENIIASWVVADSATAADVIATCLFLCPPENFAKKFAFEYCVLSPDYQIKKSANFVADFF